MDSSPSAGEGLRAGGAAVREIRGSTSCHASPGMPVPNCNAVLPAAAGSTLFRRSRPPRPRQLTRCERQHAQAAGPRADDWDCSHRWIETRLKLMPRFAETHCR